MKEFIARACSSFPSFPFLSRTSSREEIFRSSRRAIFDEICRKSRKSGSPPPASEAIIVRGAVSRAFPSIIFLNRYHCLLQTAFFSNISSSYAHQSSIHTNIHQFSQKTRSITSFAHLFPYVPFFTRIFKLNFSVQSVRWNHTEQYFAISISSQKK